MAADSRTTRSSLSAVLLLGVLVGAAAADGARLPAPKPIAPADGASVTEVPPFAWNPVRRADRYEFQIAADSGFNSPVLGRSEDHFFTRNTRATLKKTIPNGRYFWRVRAVTKSGGVSRWTAGRALRKAWTAAATLQAPAAGAGLSYPASPLRLAWSPVPGAAHYLVSIATDPQLGSLIRETSSAEAVETAATTFTRAASLAPGTFYWGITPVDAQGNRGTPSPVASFTWVWPSTTTTRLTDLVDAPEVMDPQFSWDPVPGAARYEVEVNSSQDFAPGSKVCCSSPTIARSLTPTVLFKDNTYYWRMRAIDADGNAGVWNVGPSFTKAFAKAPPVTAPVVKNLRMRDNLTDPGTDLQPATPGYQTEVPIVRWDPVPGASSYHYEVVPFTGGACNWTVSPVLKWDGTTATTAWTPLGTGWNNSKPYFDAHPVANDGSTALTPGSSYCARVRPRSDRDSANADVYGDYTYVDDGTGTGASFTFVGFPAGGSCSPSCAAGYLGSGDYVLPAGGTVSPRMPVFTWRALAGKQRYFVLVAKDASFSNIVDYAFTSIPAYAPRTSTAPETYPDETTLYHWVVLPATAANGGGAVGNPLLGAGQSFQKQSVAPTLIAPSPGAVIGGQPTFRWTLAEGARRYRVQVAQDASFGNPIEDVVTSSTEYTSTTTHPADTVLYWRVRADDEDLVGLTWSATGTFQKRLPAPVPSAANPTSGDFIPTWQWEPVPGAVSYDVSVDLPDGTHKDIEGLRMPAMTAIKMTGTGLFHWRVRANFPRTTTGTVAGPYSASVPFTRTIGEPTGARASASKKHLLFEWEPKAGAKEYRLQVSTRRDFARPVEIVTTHLTSYAPLLTRTQYEGGGVLYWRVAAVDELRNVGAFTQIRQVRLAERMRLRMRGRAVRGRISRVVVTLQSTAGKPVRGATVRVSGAGVIGRPARTGRTGRATLRLRLTKRGTLVLRAVKAGFQPATYSIRVR
jgi:hypothetical protein